MEEKVKKINDLLLEEKFQEELKKAENNEQVKDLFVSYGAKDVTVEDVEEMLRESAEIHKDGELDENDLDSVAGGVLISLTTAALFCVASAELAFFASYGYKTIKNGLKKGK